MSYLKLVDELVKEGNLKTPRIIEAFKRVDRTDFLPKGLNGQAGINAPLMIGHGQTISQPLTVALMLELLQPQPGEKILDVGYGSGWQAAILAEIVGQKKGGQVFAIEKVPELAQFGKDNIAKYGFITKGSIVLKEGDGSLGWIKVAPFDKIIAAAAAEKLPQAWKDQLRVGGRLVVPVKESVWLLKKTGKNSFSEEEYPGFAFVPLIVDGETK